jgi:hypothetical protein
MFVPDWVVCYVPALMSLLNVLPAPVSFPFVVPYLLFENTMSVTKFNAMVLGLFQLRGAYEWVVTEKSGRPSERAARTTPTKRREEEAGTAEAARRRRRRYDRMYKKEPALLLLTDAARM